MDVTKNEIKNNLNVDKDNYNNVENVIERLKLSKSTW